MNQSYECFFRDACNSFQMFIQNIRLPLTTPYLDSWCDMCLTGNPCRLSLPHGHSSLAATMQSYSRHTHCCPTFFAEKFTNAYISLLHNHFRYIKLPFHFPYFPLPLLPTLPPVSHAQAREAREVGSAGSAAGGICATGRK